MSARVYAFPYRPMGYESFARRVGLAPWGPPAPVVRMPTLAGHLAARAAPSADLVVEAMCARGTQLAGVALVRGEAVEAYGWSAVRRLAALYGRRVSPSLLIPAVFVITDHCAGWVAVSDLCREASGYPESA